MNKMLLKDKLCINEKFPLNNKIAVNFIKINSRKCP